MSMSMLIADAAPVDKSPEDTALLKLDAIVKHIRESQDGKGNPYGSISPKDRIISVSLLDPAFANYGMDENSCTLLSSMSKVKKGCLLNYGHISMNFKGKEKRKIDFNIDDACVPTSMFLAEAQRCRYHRYCPDGLGCNEVYRAA